MREAEQAPKLEEPLHLNAFNDLSTMRPTGMGMGPIPLDKIEWYARKLEMDLLEEEAFTHIIRTADVAYLNKVAEKQAKAARKS